VEGFKNESKKNALHRLQCWRFNIGFLKKRHGIVILMREPAGFSILQMWILRGLLVHILKPRRQALKPLM
jgi:hypothetical protein